MFPLAVNFWLVKSNCTESIYERIDISGCRSLISIHYGTKVLFLSSANVAPGIPLPAKQNGDLMTGVLNRLFYCQSVKSPTLF
ncbi:hypothetical protein TI10_13895 [Photorhabdus luminescens subsp. luminescens]|uniref:Uncharacterized protein n=1 Tax=Photorhabdus luminescens TaxID=29488 RepID=A0A1G5QEX2_PHOLU|nr:hypothetical protein TI10_13895 [Photorhabdus luminescens subsp. luminescens]SCZ60060.1 hypothetical protein SAMN02982990_01529 [Photorhabdus luminescens]